MFLRGIQAEKEALFITANLMCGAIRTAPKTCGIDKLSSVVLSEDDKDILSAKMRKIGKHKKIDFFIRDAICVEQAEAVVLIGTKSGPRGCPHCGYCGFGNCAGMEQSEGHCSYDDLDLGIAIGSAVAIARDHNIDNRVMFSAGTAARDLELLGEGVYKIFAIPLSVSGKNIFFDR